MSPEQADAGRRGPLIYLIAGEPSGDLLGARLMAALRSELGGRVRFAGIGGEGMAREGLESRVPLSELAIMGLVEVVPHIRRIKRLIAETASDVNACAPAALVTIDAPAFSLRVSRAVDAPGTKRIHYVAPSVWAWRPGRAKKIAAFLDHLLALLPFEPPYFEVHGLATTFVGHPATETAAAKPNGKQFRDRHSIPQKAPVICVLPGSRAGEVRRHAPIFSRALEKLAQDHAGLHALVPTVPTVATQVAAAVADWPVPTTVVASEGKLDAFAAADAALAASGTVSVELAMAGVPTIVAYKANWLSAAIAGMLLKIKFVSLVNIVLDRAAQPEFLQHRCTPRRLAEAVARLLVDPKLRAAQAADSAEALSKMAPKGKSPSSQAARAIVDVIGAG